MTVTSPPLPQLTPAGHDFALREAATSIVARIALMGYDLGRDAGWPEHYVKTSIESCNAIGEPS